MMSFMSGIKIKFLSLVPLNVVMGFFMIFFSDIEKFLHVFSIISSLIFFVAGVESAAVSISKSIAFLGCRV